MFIKNLVLILVIVFTSNFVFSQENPSKDCKSKDKGKCNSEKIRKIGCCKLKYSGGGYDYIKATEEECKSNENFHIFLGYYNPLCLEWEEK